MKKGQVELDDFKSDEDVLAADDLWFRVLKNVRAEVMPPAKKKAVAAVMERALGAENFAALQREIGQHASYRMTEAQSEAVVRDAATRLRSVSPVTTR